MLFGELNRVIFSYSHSLIRCNQIHGGLGLSLGGYCGGDGSLVPHALVLMQPRACSQCAPAQGTTVPLNVLLPSIIKNPEK